MGFCPKCKLEYDDNIKKCTDCNCDLVSSLDDCTEQTVAYCDESEDYINTLIHYLKYSGISFAESNYNDEEKSFELCIHKLDLQQVKKLLNSYFDNELKEEIESKSSDSEPTKDKESAPFVKSADKYKDLHSSAICLIIVGIIGDLYLIASLFGLTGRANNDISDILFYIVMGSLFQVFLVGGIISFKSAKIVKKNINAEETLTNDILSFMTSNYSSKTIDALCDFSQSNDSSSIPDEAKFFNRNTVMKQIITEHFGEQSDAYLDDLLEQIYDTIFHS